MTSNLPAPTRQQVQAHRGVSALAPENTLAAFRLAAEQGAKWVELDVALLGDGTLVVIHDDRIDRTTSGTGSLDDLTGSDLERLDAGNWFAPQFAGERLPTLDAVIAELGRLGLSANVEIKQHAHHKSLDQLVGAVHACISARAPQTEVMISSFDGEALKAMHKRDSALELAILWKNPPADWEMQLASIPSSTIHMHFKALSIDLLEQATRQGVQVRAWTCNNPLQLVSFWDAGLAGVITDNPSIFFG